MSIKDKIKSRLDALENDLRAGKHLASDTERTEVEDLIDSVAKFFSVLSDGDRDFINAARYAVAEGRPWT